MKKRLMAILAGALLFTVPAMAAAENVTSKFNLSLGGIVRLDYVYNSQKLGNLGFLLPPGSVKRSGSAEDMQSQSMLTARISRFWLKVAGPEFFSAKTNALIEADFVGLTAANYNSNENSELRMRQAFGTIDWPNTQVLFGQAYDIFGPAVASTVDFRQGSAFGTPNNPRVAQLRVTHKVNFNDSNSLKLVVGLQNPTEDANNGLSGDVPNVAGQLMFSSKAIGVAPGFYGMSMKGLEAGLFGLWGTQVDAPGGAKSSDVYGYGAYAFVPLLKSKDGKSRAMTASLEAQAYIASGMNWSGATADMYSATTSNANNIANGTANKGYGVYGQIIFYPIQDLGFTAGYERRNAINYNSLSAANIAGTFSFEEYNQLMYANVAYDLNAAVRVAAEYVNAKSQFNAPISTGGDSGTLNGVRCTLYYFF